MSQWTITLQRDDHVCTIVAEQELILRDAEKMLGLVRMSFDRADAKPYYEELVQPFVGRQGMEEQLIAGFQRYKALCEAHGEDDTGEHDTI